MKLGWEANSLLNPFGCGFWGGGAVLANGVLVQWAVLWGREADKEFYVTTKVSTGC